MRVHVDVYIFYCKKCSIVITDTSLPRFRYKIAEHIGKHEKKNEIVKNTDTIIKHRKIEVKINEIT